MNKKYFFTFFIIASLLFPYTCQGTMDIEPRELLISMDTGFISGNTSKKILLTNNEESIVNFTWYLDDPDPSLIRENRTVIPDLSWIDLKPKWGIVPPGESVSFYIYLKIPKNSNYIGEKWEVWATFRQNFSESMFNWEHAVRIYIDLPEENNFFLNLNLIYFFTMISIAVCLILITLLLIKKKKYKS